MARSKKIGVIDLQKAVAEVLKQYGEQVYDVLADSINEVTDTAVSKLQGVQSFASHGHPTGVYSASWGKEQVAKDRLRYNLVVRNSEHYRLTHLLEKGHANRDGGRTPAYPHIAPVNDFVNEELVKIIKNKLEGI